MSEALDRGFANGQAGGASGGVSWLYGGAAGEEDADV
jgi:hypothetical protein